MRRPILHFHRTQIMTLDMDCLPIWFTDTVVNSYSLLSVFKVILRYIALHFSVLLYSSDWIFLLLFLLLCFRSTVEALEIFSIGNWSWRVRFTCFIVPFGVWYWYGRLIHYPNNLILMEFFLMLLIDAFAGRIGIVDHDVVELNNLHRQVKVLNAVSMHSNVFKCKIVYYVKMNFSDNSCGILHWKVQSGVCCSCMPCVCSLPILF